MAFIHIRIPSQLLRESFGYSETIARCQLDELSPSRPVRSSRIMVRCRGDHSPPLESAACSRDTVGCLHGNVAQKELNLLQFAACGMAQLCTRAAKIMWSEPRKTEFLAYCFTTCQTTRSVIPSPQQGNEAHTNPTRRISNETQHHVNHRVSALASNTVDLPIYPPRR